MRRCNIHVRISELLPYDGWQWTHVDCRAGGIWVTPVRGHRHEHIRLPGHSGCEHLDVDIQVCVVPHDRFVQWGDVDGLYEAREGFDSVCATVGGGKGGRISRCQVVDRWGEWTAGYNLPVLVGPKVDKYDVLLGEEGVKNMSGSVWCRVGFARCLVSSERSVDILSRIARSNYQLDDDDHAQRQITIRTRKGWYVVKRVM